MANGVQRWMVLPDHQVPYHDEKALAVVEQYIADHRWDGLINLGDFLDFNEISKYTADLPGAVEEDLHDTYEAGRQVLDRQLKALRKRNRNARYVLLEGNHDYRATAFAEKLRQFRKLLNVPRQLDLKARRVEWIPSWSEGRLFQLGNAYFTHGLITSKFHADKMAQRYGVCIYYGHTHDVQEFPIVLHGKDQTIVGKSLGCLCRYDQKYLKGAPTNWQQAFAVFYVFPDGFYTEHTVRIFKHRFVSPEGKVYGK